MLTRFSISRWYLLATGAFLSAFIFTLPHAIFADETTSVSGRIIHLTIPNKKVALNIAEVEVLSKGKNIALKKKCLQSSTDHGGDANRAVDGNTNGNWAKNSIIHTAEEMNPCWEVDLGKVYAIDELKIYSRDGYTHRSDNLRVYVLDQGRKVNWAGGIQKAKKGGDDLNLNDDSLKGMKGKTIAKIKVKKAKSKQKKAPFHLPGKSIDVSISQADNDGILNGPLTNKAKTIKSDPLENLKLAIEDLMKTYGKQYPKGEEYLSRLEKMNSVNGDFEKLKKEALLANPLLDFDNILLVSRKGTGMPQNWQGNSSIKSKSIENSLMRYSISKNKCETVYTPKDKVYVGQYDLHYDGDRIMFSSQNEKRRWGVYEMKFDLSSGSVDENSLREISPKIGDDVDNYDATYVPGGKIIFVSSIGYSGVPCVSGNDYVGNLHSMNEDGTGLVRLCYDQENNWNPITMENGRILFQRWEYTDSAHYFSRILMTMNPDGTDQKAFYGSNSYWPNTIFFARPIPGHPSKFTGIVGAHHGAKRSGAMVLFDGNRGRNENEGAVQLIGERLNKVEALVLDNLARAYKKHHLTPYPLSDKYFLSSTQVNGHFAIALVDVFDNELVLLQDKQRELLEPVPMVKRKTPPVIPSRVQPQLEEATVFINDIHYGPGLADVPKGTAKSLRVYRYEYAPRHAGGHYAMGMESGWDSRQILGTVPIEEDGSVMFKVPANMPFAMQPLDSEGKALQIMRSWTVAMPGEVVSCVGCHEDASSAPLNKRTLASRKAPQKLTPWYGPTRGFSYQREVQPVLDKYCVGCHTKDVKDPELKDYIAKTTRIRGVRPNISKAYSEVGLPDLTEFRKSYYEIMPYIRRNGPEGDYHLLTPLSFHADTSELVQMLQKGHHGVQLDNESWDRLYTWIDLNVPLHGTWTEAGSRPQIVKRRLELRAQYASVYYNPEEILNPYTKSHDFVKPLLPEASEEVSIDGWPLAKEDVASAYDKSQKITLDLGRDVSMELQKIPAGHFLMGSNKETPIEKPVSQVSIKKSFYMGSTEVSLQQFRQFDPDFLNGVYDMHYKDQVHRGYYMNNIKFPAIRVSWEKAMAFCDWLSEKTGRKVSLPTEAQWEWACRAGSDSDFSYSGDQRPDFSEYANFADIQLIKMAVSGVNPKPIANANAKMDFLPKEAQYNDGVLHLAPVASYQANAWGLHDMHGNVAEWTRSDNQPYPYNATDGRNNNKLERKIVRGGSWRDRPFRGTASYRLAFPRWQKVFNVGFRVVIE
ncbi:MAG: SUMF1/EgtB/PvdO family nonheme iron enzyme [Planctomycetes bacterium]|nr:SUMF1/EgtB/PvdO family nonheme iron enzyme [Planctomycetota bacterium]